MRYKAFILLITTLLLACDGPGKDSRGDTPKHIPLPHAALETLIERIMMEEKVPGMAVGIWQEGKPQFLRGFGITSVDRPRPVDEHTLFKLASTTKAFTTAALALLVEEGKLKWDSRVVDFLPGFALADPWITREFRVEDLLTHRSGLGPGAGDLMLWPQPNSFSREDILAGLSHLPLSGKFRADYAYDNLLYIVAGELIESVSGQPFESFVEERLLRPLNLRECYAGPVPETARDNLADPHLLISAKIAVDTANLAPDTRIVSAAAGGMHCNAAGMLRWLQSLLAGGVTPEGRRLFSEETRDRLWKPVTLMPMSRARAQRDGGYFYTYALGWRVQDMYGKRVIHHTGSLSGMYAWTAMVPELDLAMVVLMNRSAGTARQAMIYSLLMPYLDAPERDWLAYFQRENAVQPASPSQISIPENDSPLVESDLPGLYRDAWFGDVEIEMSPDGLHLSAIKSPRLSGDLHRQAPGVWQLRWQDRTLDADAWLVARKSQDGKETFTLQPQSTNIDFSYDFADLYFVRTGKK
ncbi:MULTISPECIES: serine hydrolase [unclassified Microbulbifer]|uniref:serine hydrolase n=1 Tax=unclassified Microbulbifer TaxID=2619833 RepID=UPI0027E54D1A|nr:MULTISPECIES: serine hydrolase [unclassified Microbulbifer]